MKAIILIIATIILVSVNVLSANNAHTVTRTNHSGNQKEYIILDKHSMKPLLRKVYIDGATVITKTIYKWNDAKGWQTVSHTECVKGKNNYLQSVSYTEWNEATNGAFYIAKRTFLVYDNNTQMLSEITK